MKTRVLKVIGVSLITVSLAVSFFVIPVSALSEADGIYSETFNFPTTNSRHFGFAKFETSFNSNTFEQLRDPSYVSDPGSYINFEFSLPSSYVVGDEGAAYCSLVLGESDFGQTAFTTSNVFWVSPFTVKYRYDVPSSLQLYRLSLRTIDSNSNISAPIGYSEWINYSGGASGTIEVGNTLIPISQDSLISSGGIAGFVVCFEFYMTTASFNATSDGSIYLRFEVLDGVVTANFSKTNNPNIPSYSKPAGEDKTNELESLDQDVLDSTNDYLDELDPLLNSSLSSSINFLGNGIQFAGNLLTKFISVHPVISSVVQISLSLGIAATLLGLSGSIIGAATRRRKGGGD